MFAAGLVASIAVAAIAVPSWADDQVVYAALGDSYASGQGAGSYDPAKPNCKQSPGSAAGQFARAHDAAFTFEACANAKTADVISNQLGGLSTATSLVSIIVGGNDSAALQAAAGCLGISDSQCDTNMGAVEAQIRADLPAKLDATYNAIKEKAPNARLVVLGYPQLFTKKSSCSLLDLVYSAKKRDRVNAAAVVLNSVIKDRAEAAGAVFVSVTERFANNAICSSNSWIFGIDGDLADMGHPKPAGYTQGYLPALEQGAGLSS